MSPPLFDLFLRYNTGVRGEASDDAGAQRRCAPVPAAGAVAASGERRAASGVRSEARGDDARGERD